MGFELREIENRIEEFVSDRLGLIEPFPIAREGLEYLKNELEKKLSDLGARVSEFRVNTDFISHDTTKVEAKTRVTIKLDVKGQKVECWTNIPIRSALVSARIRDGSYIVDHWITSSGRKPVVRCYTIRE